MTQIRILNDKGIEHFTDYITAVKDNPLKNPPINELGHKLWSSEFTPHIEVDTISFGTRLEFGRYLFNLFESHNIHRKDIINISGLWSWLALFWFDCLCPLKEGSRKVLEHSKYVCSTHYTDYYRHLVAAPYDLYCIHGENSRLLLHTNLNIHGDFIEQYASRQKIITNKSLIELLDHLYWDSKLYSPKRGAQNRKRAGNFRRFQSFIKQIELTYDLNAMSSDEIAELLPEEYYSWKA